MSLRIRKKENKEKDPLKAGVKSIQIIKTENEKQVILIYYAVMFLYGVFPFYGGM